MRKSKSKLKLKLNLRGEKEKGIELPSENAEITAVDLDVPKCRCRVHSPSLLLTLLYISASAVVTSPYISSKPNLPFRFSMAQTPILGYKLTQGLLLFPPQSEVCKLSSNSHRIEPYFSIWGSASYKQKRKLIYFKNIFYFILYFVNNFI